jgi:hypothetical protein
LANVIAVGGIEGREIDFREGRGGRDAVEQEFGVRVLKISRSPIEGRRNRTSIRDGVDERASDKFSGRVGGVDGSKKVDVDKMVDNTRAKTERAAS